MLHRQTLQCYKTKLTSSAHTTYLQSNRPICLAGEGLGATRQRSQSIMQPLLSVSCNRMSIIHVSCASETCKAFCTMCQRRRSVRSRFPYRGPQCAEQHLYETLAREYPIVIRCWTQTIGRSETCVIRS